MKKLIYLALCMVTICASNAYAYEGVVAAAHKAGFTHCDKAIETEFASFIKANNKRYNISWIKEANAFNIIGTYGQAGDSVFLSVTFIDNGKKVYGNAVSTIQFPGTAVEFMHRFKNWNFVATQGGTTWTANKGGVLCILNTLPQGGVTAQYFRDFSYPRN